MTVEKVLLHPLVLLSVLDHYKRAALAPGKRVVGVLLGHQSGRTLHITNSYGVPFEEVDSEATVWYLDHDYHQNMRELSKKINARERPLGWYHSGPKLRANDLTINDLFRRHLGSAEPILAVIDVSLCDTSQSPIKTYISVDELTEDAAAGSGRNWAHLPAAIEADEAEEVGVEHLLREEAVQTERVACPAAVAGRKTFLATFDRQLEALDEYLGAVVAGRLPANADVLAHVQDIFNLLPQGAVEDQGDAQRALTVSTNDQLITLQLAALARTTIALNNLLANKTENTVAIDSA